MPLSVGDKLGPSVAERHKLKRGYPVVVVPKNSDIVMMISKQTA